MKICLKCKIRKPNKEYHFRDKPRGILRERCKACIKEYQSSPRIMEIKRISQAKYSKTKKGRATEQRHSPKRWARVKSLQRDRVYAQVRYKLKKQPCSVCGNERSQAHHDDYSKPLDVVWLCSKHHSEVHRNAKINEARAS